MSSPPQGLNHSPPRPQRGQEPTGQLIPAAKREGFDNVHDYLVHQATGESAAEVGHGFCVVLWGTRLGS